MLLPLLLPAAWFALQGFNGSSATTAVSFNLKSTRSVLILAPQDTAKLSQSARYECLPSVDFSNYIGTYNDLGDFSVQVTALAPTTLGGKPLSLPPARTTLIDRNGISVDGGSTYSYDTGEYQEMVQVAQYMSTKVNNCANSSAEVTAMAVQLRQLGATEIRIGAATVFTLGSEETWLDLTNGLILGTVTRSNGDISSDVTFQYTSSAGGEGRGEGEGCSVISKITYRKADIVSNVRVMRQMVYEFSNYSVTTNRK